MKHIVIASILALASSAQAEGMGRLFFTPEQRVLLDSARGQKVKIEERMEEPAPEIISLSGVVKRDDGHTTVWLNNRAVSDRQTAGGISIHPQGSASDPVLFAIPQADRVVTLRVGQNLDVTTGQVVEPYAPRAAAEMKRSLAEKARQTDPAGTPNAANAETQARPPVDPGMRLKTEPAPPATAAPARPSVVERAMP